MKARVEINLEMLKLKEGLLLRKVKGDILVLDPETSSILRFTASLARLMAILQKHADGITKDTLEKKLGKPRKDVGVPLRRLAELRLLAAEAPGPREENPGVRASKARNEIPSSRLFRIAGWGEIVVN